MVGGGVVAAMCVFDGLLLVSVKTYRKVVLVSSPHTGFPDARRLTNMGHRFKKIGTPQ